MALQREYDLVLADRNSYKGMTTTLIFRLFLFLKSTFIDFTERIATLKIENDDLAAQLSSIDRKVHDSALEIKQVSMVPLVTTAFEFNCLSIFHTEG